MVMYLSMLCQRGGGGWGEGRSRGKAFDCLCWPLGQGLLLILFSQGRGYLNLSSHDVEIFDCRLGRKKKRPNFHASRMRRTVWKDLEIMEANENKRKLGGFHCFVFKFRLFQRVFVQLNLLRYCGIKVNGSKEQPSRFLQVQLISVWLIRYNHCKLIKLTFFVPFTKNGIFKLTKCGLSPKGLCILRSVTRIMVKTYNCSCNRNMYLW